MQRLAILVISIVLIVTFVVAYSKNIRSESMLRFRVMGTDVQITVRNKGAINHINAAYASLNKIANLLDLYNPKSEVSIVNSLAGQSGVKVKDDTFNAIEQALFVSRLTKGAFDITLKDFNQVTIDPFEKKVYVKDKDLKIDLGGMGKGFAVEQARQTLKNRGVTEALIDMTSSMAAIGGPWTIGIKNPCSPGEVIETIVLNSGDALSTSGNYEQGEHIVDTKKNKKANTCQSVTVIAKDAGFADALSTALYVMGPSKALSLVRSLEGVKAIIVTSSGKVLKSW